jgi:hypothetical protein
MEPRMNADKRGWFCQYSVSWVLHFIVVCMAKVLVHNIHQL